MQPLNNRSMAEVMQDILGNIEEIVRSEVRLAQTEIRQELAKAARSSVVLAAGLVLAMYAGGFLLLTIMYALETALPPWLAALIVAVGVMITAMIAVGVGRRRMKEVHAPEKTVATMKENVRWAKQQIR